MKSGTVPSRHFNERRRGYKNREPIIGEFFATDVIRNPAEALVRESVQNTLDAASGDGPVRVRFYLSGAEGALPPSALSRYMTDGWPHFRAEHNELKDQPADDASCPFLAVEDFGTTGLKGDPEQ